MANLSTKCNRNDCFANKCGVACTVLNEGYPKDSDCPFFKTTEQYKEDQKSAHDHLEEIGRYDLINTYENNRMRKW